MDKELLHTYFRGEATPEEEKQIMDWAESSPENYQEYLKERKIWNAILMYSVNPTIKATATHKRLFLIQICCHRRHRFWSGVLYLT